VDRSFDSFLLFLAEANVTKDDTVPDTVYTVLKILDHAEEVLRSGLQMKITQQAIADFLSSSPRAGTEDDPSPPSKAPLSKYTRAGLAAYFNVRKLLDSTGPRAWQLVRDGCQDPFDPVFSLSNLRELVNDKSAVALTSSDVEQVCCMPTRERTRAFFTWCTAR
jgi:hypothetical protein